jgi:hypothetical protein
MNNGYKPWAFLFLFTLRTQINCQTEERVHDMSIAGSIEYLLPGTVTPVKDR